LRRRRPGICVCELEECFEMGQSRVSYHMRKLKDAGLVREERRGRWSFYSLDREATRDLLADTGKHLSAQLLVFERTHGWRHSRADAVLFLIEGGSTLEIKRV
jgi:DNA-binding transcriptional ArsR family regulator